MFWRGSGVGGGLIWCSHRLDHERGAFELVQVTAALLPRLDDPKRAVRKRAAVSRHKWFLLGVEPDPA